MPKHYVTRLAAALGTGQGAERLYDAYGPSLYRYCWAMLADPAEAAGALTDAVLVATAHTDALADTADLTPWVYALARAECLRRTPGAYGAGGAAGRWASGPYAAGPYAAGEADDVLTMLVARALAGLSPADREFLELSVRHRLSERQLALVLGLAEHEGARASESAVTRFDQTLSTLFMAASGRLAVPRELLTDRPPIRVLLDLLRPARPPAGLAANITAACTDPAMSHYRDLVARRALPLTPAGFPRAPRPPATGAPVPDQTPGAPAVPHPRAAPATETPPPRTTAAPGGAPAPGTAFRPRAAAGPRNADMAAAEPGTAAMPLGAPAAPPAEGTAGPRPSGGRPVIEPVAGDIITPEAISRARTGAPPDAPADVPSAADSAARTGTPPEPAAAPSGRPRDDLPEIGETVGVAGSRPRRRGRREAGGEHAASADGAGEERGQRPARGRRRRERGSPAARFRQWVGVVVAVAAVAAGVWAGTRIVESSATVTPRPAPDTTATGGGNGGAAMPTGPGRSPSHAATHPRRPAETGVPVVTPGYTAKSGHGHGHPRRSRHRSPSPAPVGPLEPSTPHRSSSTPPDHTPTHSATPTRTETPTPPQE